MAETFIWEKVDHIERTVALDGLQSRYRTNFPDISIQTISGTANQENQLKDLRRVLIRKITGELKKGQNFSFDLPFKKSIDGLSSRLFFVCDGDHLPDLNNILDIIDYGIPNMPTNRPSLLNQ